MKACLRAYAGAAMLSVVAAGCLGREEPDGCDGGKSTKTEVNYLALPTLGCSRATQ